MGKKKKEKKRQKKLRKRMCKRGLEGAPAVVVCVGKDCCDRATSRQLADDLRAHGEGSLVRVEVVGCLHVCKKGPIVATYPEIEIHRKVTRSDALRLFDRVAGELGV